MDNQSPQPAPPPKNLLTLKSGKKNKLFFIIIIAVSALLILALVIPAVVATFLGAGVRRAIKESGVVVNEKNGTVAFRGPEGETIIETEASILPKGFPTDFPSPPRSKILSSSVTASAEDLFFTVVWESDGDVNYISEFMQDSLENVGWTMTFYSSSADGVSFSFSRGKGAQKDQGSITVSRDSATNKIETSLLLGIKK